MIKKVFLAECGYCVNDIKHVFKNTRSKKYKFPANCFVFKHETHGYILFDTGYSTRLFRGGLVSKLYTLLNPTFVHDQDTLAYKLTERGIDPKSINYVILSHMHPDHLAGLKDFENAKIIISKGTYETYKNRKAWHLIFDHFIPDDFEDRLTILEDHANQTSYDNQKAYELFGTDLLFIDLSGHTLGQLGLILPKAKLLIASDAYWFKEEVFEDKSYTGITKKIMANYRLYKSSHSKIKGFLDNDQERRVVSSHEKINTAEELGYVVETYDFEILS